MVNLAHKNALKVKATNVEFIHSRINSLPIENDSVDCIISNCVLNLVPDEEKASVFNEIYRVLKPGGRIAVSDLLAYRPLPQDIIDDPALQVGCVSGAVTVPRMQGLLKSVGFTDALLVDTKKDLNLYKDSETAVSVTPCCSGETSCGPVRAIGPSGRKPLDYDLNKWIGTSRNHTMPLLVTSQVDCLLGAFQIYALKATANKPPDGVQDNLSAVEGERTTVQKPIASKCCGGGSC